METPRMRKSGIKDIKSFVQEHMLTWLVNGEVENWSQNSS